MDLGTQLPSTATGRHAELIGGQLHGFGLKAPVQSEARVEVKKNKQPTTSEYRQLVLLLQKRLKQTEAENRAYCDQQKKIEKRCRIQRKLINHLREEVDAQSQQISDFEQKYFISNVKDGEQPRDSGGRVVSLNSALLRISGVEVPTEEGVKSVSEKGDAIDMEEFQDIEESLPASARLNGQFKTVAAKFEAMPFRLFINRRAGSICGAMLELQSRVKTKIVTATARLK